MIRPYAVLGGFVISILLVPPLLLTQGDIGKSPREVLPPKLLREIQQPQQQVPDSVAQQLAYLAAQMRQNQEQLREMLSVSRQVAESVPRITNLEARMTAMETSQHADPTNIAVLQTQRKEDSEAIMEIRTLIWSIAGGVGTLIVGAVGVLLKRQMTKGNAPEWAQAESGKQEEFRIENRGKFEEIAQKAERLYQAQNNINEKLPEIVKLAVLEDHNRHK